MQPGRPRSTNLLRRAHFSAPTITSLCWSRARLPRTFPEFTNCKSLNFSFVIIKHPNTFCQQSILGLNIIFLSEILLWNCVSSPVSSCELIYREVLLLQFSGEVALSLSLTGHKVAPMSSNSKDFFTSVHGCCFIAGLMAQTKSYERPFTPGSLTNSPCSRTAWAPCGKDVAVGVSSSSRMVCGSGRPLQGSAGPLSSLWRPLPAPCHAPWRPWDLEETHRGGDRSDQWPPANVAPQPESIKFRLWAKSICAYGNCVAGSREGSQR